MKKVVYITSSEFKQHENEVFQEVCGLTDGKTIKDVFEFEIQPHKISERLEVKLEDLVMSEVIEAYDMIKVPCIVEHAGLIFEKYKKENYPGGLTKPMWNTLGSRFVEETNSANQKVVAKAVVAYCDGMKIKTFVGETNGTLVSKPRGSRKFYWDTIFIPNGSNKTYAEIAVNKHGLEEKMKKYSQSAKAMLSFLKYLQNKPSSDLWQ